MGGLALTPALPVLEPGQSLDGFPRPLIRGSRSTVASGRPAACSAKGGAAVDPASRVATGIPGSTSRQGRVLRGNHDARRWHLGARGRVAWPCVTPRASGSIYSRASERRARVAPEAPYAPPSIVANRRDRLLARRSVEPAIAVVTSGGRGTCRSTPARPSVPAGFDQAALTSIVLGVAACGAGTLTSSMPLAYFASTWAALTPSGRAKSRWNAPYTTSRTK
jgi:hypothetical protein